MNKLNHVAFIMDGNGRWGMNKGKGRNFGHLKGLETVKNIVKSSIKLNIPIITFYVFSSENWKRPKKEINFLFKLIKTYFSTEIKNVITQGIKINVFGDLKKITLDVRTSIKNTVSLTKKNKKKLNIKNFEQNLYTKNIPNPDILIRTGGHKRLSNFMLWQLAYAELFFLNKLWPDFNKNDLIKIIKIYKNSKRNFGSI